MSEEAAKDQVAEATEQTEQKSDEQPEQQEPKPEAGETGEGAKEGEGTEGGEGAEGAEGGEGKQEEPEVKEKPQLSDPEEPDDDVPIVLVTGASGYVGTHLIKQLLEQGRFRVRGTVRNLSNEKKVKPLRELVAEPKYPLRLIEADLQNPKSWTEAVRRCRYVFHVASPFPVKIPKNADVLIKPAVEGTTNVLRACAESGTVKRVVLTSSVAAISSGMNGNEGAAQDHVYTESDWSTESTCPPYERSKLKAEQAAWEFMKQLEEGKRFELVTVCPGGIVGPLLSASSGDTSAQLAIMPLTNNGFPDVSFAVIDVRDVAAAHIAAVEKPEAAGNRYLLVYNETIAARQMVQILATEFKPQGYKVPTKPVPKAGVWFAKLFNAAAKQLYPLIGKQLTWSNEKMKSELGIEPRDIETTMIDMGYSVIELGLVQKKRGYLGHPSTRPPPEKKEEGEGEAAATPAQGAGAEEDAPKEESKEKPEDTQAVSSPEQVSEQPQSQEPQQEEQPSEPAKEEERPSEPAKDEEQPSEPAKEEEPSSEPAKEEEPPSEPPQEEPPSEPAKEEEPPSEPAKEEEPPSEPTPDEPPQEQEEQPSEPAQEEQSKEQDEPPATQEPEGQAEPTQDVEQES